MVTGMHWNLSVERTGNHARRLLAVLTAVAVLMLAFAPTVLAKAGKPVLVDRWDDSFVEEPDLFVLDFCGVEVGTEFHFKGSFTLYEDGSAKVHETVDITSYDLVTGDPLFWEKDAYNIFIEPEIEIVDEEAGTVTLMFDDTVKGKPLAAVIPGQGVLILDAGVIQILTTVVLDLETGDLISIEDETPVVHGPHPAFEQTEEEAQELFCGAMGA